MSTPAQGGPAVVRGKDKDKKSVGDRMLTRVKTMMKRSSKRTSTSGQPAQATSTTTEARDVNRPAAATAAAVAEAPKKAAEEPHPDVKKVSRMKLHEERARKLGERYGVEIRPSEWHSTEGDALRIEKPIRMRVHRVCHMCQHSFGAAKECPHCKHERCKSCVRFPPKRTEAEKQASRERRAAILKERAENPPIAPDWDATNNKKPIILTRPGKNGGQDLVYKKHRQRVRRNCCQCDKLFNGAKKTCDGCSHTRCTECPRDPDKKKYYPFGYPGDEFGTNSVPYHACEACKTQFPPASVDGTQCARCSHTKCGECPRMKPRRVEPAPDPEILRSIESRLAKLRVG